MTNKREAILAATLDLLASKGFHGFSIRDVAHQAGVGTGTVYLYFVDRDDLIKQLHAQILEKVAQFIFTDYDAEQSLFEQFRYMCVSFWEFFLQQPAILLSKSQFDHLPPDVLRTRHEDAKAALHLLFTFFERGRREGVFKNLPDEILFSLGFEPYFEIARKHMFCLIVIDGDLLDAVILASWDALVVQH